MIYDIVISDQAEIDLRGIFEYIAFELQAPENASGQLDRLEACIMDAPAYCEILLIQVDVLPGKTRNFSDAKSCEVCYLNR